MMHFRGMTITAREAIAFAIAPLPIYVFIFVAIHQVGWSGYLLLPGLITIVAHAGAFLFGLPIYLFLRARRWVTFWFAPAAGYIVAVPIWACLGVLVLRDHYSVSTHLAWMLLVLWPCGPLGAVIGILLWLIARPDRAMSRG